MSGLYNMVMGQSPIFKELALSVGITAEFVRENPIGRIRDAWISSDAKKIYILHRNYGTDGAKANENIKKLPSFVSNQYDSKDPTYGWWEFDVLPGGSDDMYVFLKLAAEKTDNRNCMERYREILDKLSDPSTYEEPGVQRALEAGRKIANGLNYAAQEGIAEVKHEGSGVIITSPID